MAAASSSSAGPSSGDREDGLDLSPIYSDVVAPPTAPPIPLPPLRGELRYELNAPQRLGAIVVIATVSALLLLLLLFGVSELTQLFEQLTAS